VQPRVLVVAPLSGHFATLLRRHGARAAAEHDVHITDWANAMSASGTVRLGFDEYVEHLIRFLEGDGTGRTYSCRLPALRAGAGAAAALMAEDDNPAQPRSMTLMAGPIDTDPADGRNDSTRVRSGSSTT
jgi:polyhydroxyalkanoate depolymerase